MDTIHTLREVSAETEKLFGCLSADKLNFKPSPNKWSIAQVLHHLMVSNQTYYPQFEAVLNGTYRPGLYQHMGFIARFMGRQMIHDLGPERRKTFKNPPLFAPSQSHLSGDIVEQFLAQQQTLVHYVQQLQKADTRHIIISSPAAGFIIYSLHDALQTIAVHEQRHLQQAKEVLPLLPL